MKKRIMLVLAVAAVLVSSASAASVTPWASRNPAIKADRIARGGPYGYIVHAHATFPNGSSAPGATVTAYDQDGGLSCSTDGNGNCNIYFQEGHSGVSFRVSASKCGYPGVAHTFYYSGSYYTSGYQPNVNVAMYYTVSGAC